MGRDFIDRREQGGEQLSPTGRWGVVNKKKKSVSEIEKGRGEGIQKETGEARGRWTSSGFVYKGRARFDPPGGRKKKRRKQNVDEHHKIDARRSKRRKGKIYNVKGSSAGNEVKQKSCSVQAGGTPPPPKGRKKQKQAAS